MLDLITKAGSGFAIFCLVACIFTFARLRFVEILLVVYLHQLENVYCSTSSLTMTQKLLCQE